MRVRSGCLLRGRNFIAQRPLKGINENFVAIRVSDHFRNLIAEKLAIRTIHQDNSHIILVVVIVCASILALLLSGVIIVGLLILKRI